MQWTLIALFVLLTSCGASTDLDRSFRQSEGSTETGPESNENLRIIIIDVGQGDATLLIAPGGETVLIDAGPPDATQNAILPLFDTLNISAIDYIFATHFHADHIGGIPAIIQKFQPTRGIYDRGIPEGAAEDFAVEVYGTQGALMRHTAYPGLVSQLGGVDVEVVAANGALEDGTKIDLGEPRDENAASLALLIEYGAFRMLVAGDVTGGGGTPPYETPDIETPLGKIVGDIDVLRVSHHGSHTSTNKAFLGATKPETAIISVGNGNDYFHPHRSVVDRLLESGIKVYQTERGWSENSADVNVGGNIIIDAKMDGSYAIELEH